MKDYPHLAEAIANVIENIRVERKMSKTLLSDTADMQRCYLQDILKCKKKPTMNTIFSICEALQISPDCFVRLVLEEMGRLEVGSR